MMDSLFIKNKRRNGYQPCCSRNLLDRILLTMWHSLFPCQPGAASEISLILAKSKGIVYNERRKSTHSKADAPKRDYLPLNERRLSCGPDRRGIIFFACSSYLCRERQATPQSSCQRTLAEPISL